MRRLASAVFTNSSRRNDKSDTQAPGLVRKKSRAFPSLSRKHLSADPPPLVASDLVNSSSSSSSGSTAIRTPDDDGLPRTPSKKGSWKSWLGGKNAPSSDHPGGHHLPPWQSSQNVSSPPKSNETDGASLLTNDPCPNRDAPAHSPQLTASAHANARAMIMNSLLVHDPTSAPLFLPPDAISFPRSCHNSRRLHRRETLESELHKKSLLARLDQLSPPEASTITPLALKSISRKPQPRPKFHDDLFPSSEYLTLQSRGLQKWVSRSYFEDRVQLWTCADSGDIIRARIPGSHLGVAALEFSEPLELLAGTLLENDEVVDDVMFEPALEFMPPRLTLNLDHLVTQTNGSETEPLSRPSDLSHTVDSSTKSSPLHQPGNISLDVSSSAQQPSEPTAPGSAPANDLVPKRGVRFADDNGKDDQIPLGYVLRIRKNKEQKARFLREERERRQRTAQLSKEDHRPNVPQQSKRVSGVFDTPRRPPPRPLVSLSEPSRPHQPMVVSQVVTEEERLRLEVEKIEMEKLRRSRELAKKQAEERERAYTEELQATRARREAFRAGRPLELAPLSPRVPDRDRSASRDSVQTSLRGSSTSHKYTPELVFTPVSPREGSPSSSIPATPRSQYSLSRPPSIYSSHTASSEDVRGRDSKRFSRRMSVVSDPTKGVSLYPPYDPRASFNPYAWTNVPPVPPIPAIPMVNGMPMYGMDMPLLPPTPPFMMNQFGVRSRSYTGIAGQHSPLQSLTSLPRNGSSEGVNSSSRNSSPHSSGSHQRRSSDDAARMVKTMEDMRPGSYNDVRGSRMSISVRGVPPQGSPKRSSWVPPEQNSIKKSSSLRPVSGTYSSGTPVHARRRTAAS